MSELKAEKKVVAATTLQGSLVRWVLCDYEREYGVATLPFAEAYQFIAPKAYSALTNQGNQRTTVASHANKIRREMQEGRFTPTTMSASCTKEHVENLVRKKDGTFELKVFADKKLLLSDGGHRCEAIQHLIDGWHESLTKVHGEDREEIERLLAQARAMPVTFVIYFDGNPQLDFVNLQSGRAVDATHMLSLKIRQQMSAKPELQMAFDVARILDNQDGSPFKEKIRFDSRSARPLPWNTLASANLSASLIGLAKAGARHPGDKKTRAQFLADCVCEPFETINSSEDDDIRALCGHGQALTPLSNEGTRGSSTMIVGVGALLAYRVLEFGRVETTDEDLERLVGAALNTLAEPIRGNFSDPLKRRLMGQFAKDFLSDIPGPRHDGLPISLLKTFSASSFGVTPLPKEPKEPKVPKVDEVELKGEAPWEEPSEIEQVVN